jgi:carbon storage regulator
MLLLTRKETEEIKIGDAITIRVLKSRHGKTLLGIEAPRDVKVLRSELLIKTERDDATAGA